MDSYDKCDDSSNSTNRKQNNGISAALVPEELSLGDLTSQSNCSMTTLGVKECLSNVSLENINELSNNAETDKFSMNGEHVASSCDLNYLSLKNVQVYSENDLSQKISCVQLGRNVNNDIGASRDVDNDICADIHTNQSDRNLSEKCDDKSNLSMTLENLSQDALKEDAENNLNSHKTELSQSSCREDDIQVASKFNHCSKQDLVEQREIVSSAESLQMGDSILEERCSLAMHLESSKIGTNVENPLHNDVRSDIHETTVMTTHNKDNYIDKETSVNDYAEEIFPPEITNDVTIEQGKMGTQSLENLGENDVILENTSMVTAEPADNLLSQESLSSQSIRNSNNDKVTNDSENTCAEGEFANAQLGSNLIDKHMVDEPVNDLPVDDISMTQPRDPSYSTELSADDLASADVSVYEDTSECLPKENLINESENTECAGDIINEEDMVTNGAQSADKAMSDEELSSLSPLVPTEVHVSDELSETNFLGQAMSEDVHITDLTQPPTIQLGDLLTGADESSLEEVIQAEVSGVDHSKDAAEVSAHFADEVNYENGASLLKILPIRNGHGLWNVEELRLMLEDRGHVVLRLFLDSKTANDDSENCDVDFTALLLEDDVKLPVESKSNFSNFRPKPEFEENPSKSQPLSYWSELGIDTESLKETAQSSLNLNNVNPPLPPHGSSSIVVSPRGRKRGRPPLNFRPPRFNGEFANASHRPSLSPPPSMTESSSCSRSPLASPVSDESFYFPKGKKALNTPSSVSKKRLLMTQKAVKLIEKEEAQAEKRRNQMAEKESAQLGLDNGKANKEKQKKDPGNGSRKRTGVPAKPFVKIYCPHCPVTFRKKLSQIAHIRIKHKSFKVCPICKENVKMIKKTSLKSHVLKYHNTDTPFTCEHCGDAFKLPAHLKTHVNTVHKEASSREASESEDEGEISDQKEESSKKRKINSSEDETNLTVVNSSKRILRSRPQASNLETDETILDKRSGSKRQNSRHNSSGTSPARRRTRAKKDDSSSSSSESENEERSESGNDSDDESEAMLVKPKKRTYTCSQCQEQFCNTFKLSCHKRQVHSTRKTSLPPKNESNTSVTPHKRPPNSRQSKLHENDEQMHPNSSADDNVRSRATRRSTSSTPAAETSTKRFSRSKQTLEESFRAVSNASRRLVLEGRNASKCRVLEERNGSKTFLKERESKIVAKKASRRVSEEANGDSNKDSDDSDDEHSHSTNGTKSSSNWPSYVRRKGNFFHCGQCKLTFKRERLMTYHLKKIHETLYPFRKCPDCPRIFRSCGPYARHLREHRGRKCPVEGCKAKYKILRMIKKHQRNAHPDLPHRCSRCINLYAKEEDLEKHMDEQHSEETRDRVEEERNSESEDEEENYTEGEKQKVQDEDEQEEQVATPSKHLSSSEDASRRIRKCNLNISFKEHDDDEELVDGSPKTPLTFPPTYASEVRSAKVVSQPVVFSEQSFNNAPPKTPKRPSPKETPDRPKRRYIRRAPYRRKVDNSWTAALKARCYGLSPEQVKKEFSVYRPAVPSSRTPPSASSPPPVVVDDLVRRVTESVTQHHERNRYKKTALPRAKPGPKTQPASQQRRPKGSIDPSMISYSPNALLPRVSYSNIVGSSRDTSVSSFEDLTDQSSMVGYVYSPFSPVNQIGTMDEQEELRFDSF